MQLLLKLHILKKDNDFRLLDGRVEIHLFWTFQFQIGETGTMVMRQRAILMQDETKHTSRG